MHDTKNVGFAQRCEAAFLPLTRPKYDGAREALDNPCLIVRQNRDTRPGSPASVSYGSNLLLSVVEESDK